MATKNAQFIQSDQCLLQNGSNYILNNNNILKKKQIMINYAGVNRKECLRLVRIQSLNLNK